MIRIKRAAMMAALAGVALCLAACEPLTLTAKDNGRAVALAPGDRFKLILESNPSTGYRWEVRDLDAAVLKQGDVLALAPDPNSAPVVGAPVTMVWTFETVAPGHTQLKLVYHAPAPQPGAQERTYTADVTVR